MPKILKYPKMFQDQETRLALVKTKKEGYQVLWTWVKQGVVDCKRFPLMVGIILSLPDTEAEFNERRERERVPLAPVSRPESGGDLQFDISPDTRRREKPRRGRHPRRELA